MLTLRRSSLVGISAVLWAGSAASQGAGPIFQRVADTATVIPDGKWAGQPFGSFTASGIVAPPGISQGNVIFLGTPISGAQNGVYTWSGGHLSLLADPTTPVPGNSETQDPGVGIGSSASGAFSEFRYPSVDGHEFAFSSYTDIWRTDHGTLRPILNRQFSGTSRPALDGADLWFFGEKGTFDGVYRERAGVVMAIALEGMPAPSAPGYQLTSLNSNVDGAHGTVAFQAASGVAPGDASRSGIYKYARGELRRVADSTMAAPGGGDFVGFSNTKVSCDGDAVGFLAYHTLSGGGIYVERNGVVEAIAVNAMNAPGGGRFSIPPNADTDVAVDAGHVAIRATAAGRDTIFTDADGSLHPVIAVGDKLMGRTVKGLSLGVEGLSGNDVAFWASFTDGTSGLYIATVPEPAWVGLSLVSLLIIRRRTRPAAGR